MPMSQDDGAAAVNFKAVRRCVFCLRENATPDTLCCANCMRAMQPPSDPALMQNTVPHMMADLDALRARMMEVAVYMPDELRPPWWRRAWRWLRNLTWNAP